jgi:hypothetical protein
MADAPWCSDFGSMIFTAAMSERDTSMYGLEDAVQTAIIHSYPRMKEQSL